MVLRNVNDFGRVALCGAISTYNSDPKDNKGKLLFKTDMGKKGVRFIS